MRLSNLDLLIPKNDERPRESYSWGKVVSIAPVKVRMDGFSEAISINDTLTPVGIGDRVYVQYRGMRITILGKSGGSSVLDAYPVGSYYWSSNPTSPAVLFGGVWERVENRFVYAASSSHQAGETGGEENHTLTISEMPSHAHRTSVGWGSGNLGAGVARVDANSPQKYFANTGSTGGGQPHNNMPPYIAAYCWHRTA